MVSFLASFLPRKDRKSAPRAEPFPVASTAPSTALVPLSTPLATPVATPETTPLATLETTPERTPTSTLIPVPEPTPAPIYVIRDRNAGTVVGLSRQPVLMATPWTHAADLLEFLMEDDALVGQVATEKALRAYYLAACRQKGIRPFRWLAVLRQLNALLRRIYGSAYRKSYRNIYEAGRLRKRRVYRVPTVEDLAQSAHQDAAVVERAEEKRRRA